MASAFRKAYAVLGLPPHASPGTVKRRYKRLVRRWHPDRFDAEPVARTEATARMREINRAYALIEETARRTASFEPRRERRSAPVRVDRPRVEPLRRDADETGTIRLYIRAFLVAVGTTLYVVAAVLWVAGLIYSWYPEDAQVRRNHPGILLLPLYVVWVVLREILGRRRNAKSDGGKRHGVAETTTATSKDR